MEKNGNSNLKTEAKNCLLPDKMNYQKADLPTYQKQSKKQTNM